MTKSHVAIKNISVFLSPFSENTADKTMKELVDDQEAIIELISDGYEIISAIPIVVENNGAIQYILKKTEVV